LYGSRRGGVRYYIDPATNILSETACLSTVNLLHGSTTITVTGIEYYVLRTLVWDSTRDGLDLGLIVPKQKETGSEDKDTLAHAIKRKLLQEDGILDDPEDTSFAACTA